MNIHIYILCYNEAILLPRTIAHYKKYLPSCKITIYDNHSTDNSVQIAISHGCNVISWDSNNKIDDFKYIEIKNNCWKEHEEGWILMIDMDEWLCVTEQELLQEKNNNTTILQIQGYNIVGCSSTTDLSDIDLHTLNRGAINDWESKKLCFYRPDIIEINYNQLGAHTCNPIGNIKYSNKIYINKHMEYMGLPFIIDKIKKRFERSADMRSQGFAIHYTDNINLITEKYNNNLKESIEITI